MTKPKLKPPITLRFVIKGAVQTYQEDGGQTLIADIDDPRHHRLWVQLRSWDDDKRHPELKALAGKVVEITIEVQEEKL